MFGGHPVAYLKDASSSVFWKYLQRIRELHAAFLEGVPTP